MCYELGTPVVMS